MDKEDFKYFLSVIVLFFIAMAAFFGLIFLAVYLFILVVPPIP